jgi:hypothetical protein
LKVKLLKVNLHRDDRRQLTWPEKVQKKYAEAALDELVSGNAVSQPNTKAIGCTIKWREA